MKTTKWGPPGWKFLHTIAHNYPENPTSQDKINYKLFFAQCEHVLPCKYCRQSFHEYLIELPIDNYLNSRQEVAYWLFLVHNKVNDKLRKQNYDVKPDPEFAEICRYYENYRAGCGKTPGKGPSCRIPVDVKQRRENVREYLDQVFIIKQKNC